MYLGVKNQNFHVLETISIKNKIMQIEKFVQQENYDDKINKDQIE